MVFVSTIVVGIFGVLVAIAGLWGVLRPQNLQAWIKDLSPQARLATAVLTRAVFGVASLVAASASSFPTALQALGALALFAALVLLFLGAGWLESWAKWWAERSATVIRIWSLAAAVLGGFLVYAVA